MAPVAEIESRRRCSWPLDAIRNPWQYLLAGAGAAALSAFERIPFFEGLGPSEAERYARHCAWKRFSEQELVLDFDDVSTDVYFIISGDVRVLVRTTAGREVILGELGAGQFFGEMAAIDGAKRSANVTALTKTELCAMPAHVFKNIVLSTPVVCDRLLRILTHRVRELDGRLFEHSVLQLRHRLYAELLRLSARRKGFDGQLIISPPPVQQDLAARIGCRREQVSREIRALIEEGLAEKTRGGLVILQPALLRERVSEALDQAD